jgi:hypothetical protein
LIEAERVDQLIEKQRHAVIDLDDDAGGVGSAKDLGASAKDDLVALGSNEFVKHSCCSTLDQPLRKAYC